MNAAPASPRTGDALIVVDLQPTFLEADPALPGSGELPVTGAAQIIPLVNRLGRCFEHVVATKDHHPSDHLSFASQYDGKRPLDVISSAEVRAWLREGRTFSCDAERLLAYLDRVGEQVLWPDHGRAGTPGGELHPGLVTAGLRAVISKGTNRYYDSYSAFFDNGRFTHTRLHSILGRCRVKRLYVCGLALDFCCYFTALDALDLGYEVVFIEDATRAVDQPAGRRAMTLADLRRRGADVVNAKDVLA